MIRHPPRLRSDAGMPGRKEPYLMTHTVCQPCHDCKYTDCVDCEACVPECPVEAIFAEANVPSQWASFTPLNAERSAAPKESGGGITEKSTPQEGPECKKK